MNSVGQKQKEIQNTHDVSIFWVKHKEGDNSELYVDVYKGRHRAKKVAILSQQGRACEVGFTTVCYNYYAESAMGKAKNEMLDKISAKLSNKG